MPTFMAERTERDQQIAGIVPRFLELVEPIDKMVLSMMYLQLMNILTDDTLIIVPGQNSFPLLFPPDIKQRGAVSTVRIWSIHREKINN